jgi:hypothetical protein
VAEDHKDRDKEPPSEFEGLGGGSASSDRYYARRRREEQEYITRRDRQDRARGEESNPALGWLIFFLIFGVGNVILYATTGMFLIPIPRR